MQVKLCGFTELEPLEYAVSKGCHFVGCVFVKDSIRFVSLSDSKVISSKIPKSIKKVAVVVNPTFDYLNQINQFFLPDIFQFHGQEDPEFLKEVRHQFSNIKIIKAFPISEKFDFSSISSFDKVSDYFLFDNKTSGSGEIFDWKLLLGRSFSKPWFLSGGLNIKNLQSAIESTGASLIDISSGIEEVRGRKSLKLIDELMKKIHHDFHSE